MAKSRVEKNKKLYDELAKDEFELEDISEIKEKKKNLEVMVEETSKEESATEEFVEKKLPVKKEEKKSELVPVKEEKKLPATRKEKKEKKKVELVEEEDFVVEQPISYNDKLVAEEALRARLEKQQELKDKKRGYKKTPYASNYSAEAMQKNISQFGGVDVRKEVNLKVKRSGNAATLTILFFLLCLVIVAGLLVLYIIW